MKTDVIINRDALCALRELPDESVHCCVTSPPYYALRDYGLDAAATDKTAKCPLYYTPETDGLSQSWDRGWDFQYSILHKVKLSATYVSRRAYQMTLLINTK